MDSESDAASIAIVEALVKTAVDYVVDYYLILAGKDRVDGVFARYVFYLAARQRCRLTGKAF